MSLSKALQVIEESIRRPRALDDTVLLSETDNAIRQAIAELNPETLVGTLNAVISQIRQLTFGTTPANWSDVPPATIKSLADALASFSTSLIYPVINEVPAGFRNNDNLVYATAFEFNPGTLEVWLGGMKLSPLLDYTENIDYQGFTIVISPEEGRRLNSPPTQAEDLLVNYSKKP